MLVLLSFILAWGELWFLDFRVLPLEQKAREVEESILGDSDTASGAGGGGAGSVSGERQPLLTNQPGGSMLHRLVNIVTIVLNRRPTSIWNTRSRGITQVNRFESNQFSGG